MQLTTEQKEKFLTYLDKKGLPGPNTKTNTSNISKVLDETEITNLISYCIADILLQLNEQDLPKVEKIKINSNEFNLKLNQFFTAETVNYLIESIEENEDYKLFLAALQESEDSVDIFIKIALQAQNDTDIANTLLVGIVMNYIKKCTELTLTPDPNIILFTFKSTIK